MSKVFVREATGLVKDISTLDAFWFNFYANSPILAGFYVFILVPLLFPGGDIVVGGLIATLCTLAVGMVYVLVTATMPRSGGDYVFVSRTFHPVIGFFSSFNFSYWIFAFWGFNAFLTVTYFGGLVSNLGLTGVSGWLATPNGLFVGGSIVSILGALVMVLRPRYYMTLQRVVAVYALIIAFVVIAILLSGASNFHQTFNQWAIANQAVNGTDPYQTVIDTAKSQGYVNPGFNWPATAGVVVVMWAGLLTAWASSWISGEIKNAQSIKTQMASIAGSTIGSGLVLVLLGYALVSTIGYDFFGSVVTSASSFPALSSNYTFYVTILAPSVMPFINLAFVLAAFILIPMDIFTTTRSMFAWSFDRIIPSSISKVSDRFFTPVFSVAISFVVAEFLIYLFAFGNAVGLYMATTFGVMVTYLIASFAAIVFPYTRKKMFDSSPAKYRVGGIPLMTIIGILSVLFMVYLTYYYITVPGLAGFSLVTLESLIVLFIVATAIFFISRAYHKSKGLEIDLAFKEIPPE